jgi:hypothetical protein
MDSTGHDQNHTSSPQTSTRSLTNPKNHSLSTNGNDHEPTTDDTHLTLESPPGANDLAHDTSQPKSPLLTSHRLSTTSLDNVNLGEDVDPHTVIPNGRKPRKRYSLAKCIIRQMLMAQLY